MRKIFLFSIVSLLFAAFPTSESQAQIREIIIAVIKQADIAVQKAQNVVLGLQNAQKEIENQLSQLKLGEIGDWEQKIKDIYSEYYTELWQVKTAISYFKEITDIVAQQQQLVTEYKQAFNLFKQDKHFTPAEISYIYRVYTGIINQSAKSLDQIILVLTSFSLQMSDAARLALIKQASHDIQQQTNDLRNFNNQTAQVSLQRAKNQQEINTIKSLYGL